MWPSFLVLDFDGVLVDSVGVKGTSFGAAVSGYPTPMVERFVAFHFANGGVDRRTKFAYFLTEIAGEPATDEKVQLLCDRFSACTEAGVITARAIAGADELLAEAPSDTRIAVLSATPEAELRRIIEARDWTRHVDLIIGTPARKPETLRAWTVDCPDPGRRLYVGDAISDFAAARDAAWPFIGVTDTSGVHPFPPEVTVVRDLHELRRRFNGD